MGQLCACAERDDFVQDIDQEQEIINIYSFSATKTNTESSEGQRNSPYMMPKEFITVHRKLKLEEN